MTAKLPARRFSALACAVTFALSITCPSLALAEGSIDDIPDGYTEAAKRYIAYMEDFDRRYPDSGDVNVDQVIAEEGEMIATLYCDAIGIGAPCAPNADDGSFVRLGAATGSEVVARGDFDWWEWLVTQNLNIGVIPEVNSCPAGTQYVQLYMDDEDTRNANNRSGWIGATASGSNTSWRFCKLNASNSVQFRPLAQTGTAYNYAVMNMGVFCPPGATRVMRYQDNQNAGNNNSQIGNPFPSVNVLGRNRLTFACHFHGGAYSPIGPMSAFPNLGFKYGVFGPDNSPFALLKGWVYQDDEDSLNLNVWGNHPGNSTIFSGTTNTMRKLMRVR
jgi:hypothetical protein